MVCKLNKYYFNIKVYLFWIQHKIICINAQIAFFICMVKNSYTVTHHTKTILTLHIYMLGIQKESIII